MDEHRRAPRNRTYLKAEIDLNGLSSLACTIRDLNDIGARIALSDGVVLPEAFRLHLPKQDRWVRVHVRWRRGDNVGLQFDDEVKEQAAAAGDETARMRQLEAEIVRLRRMLEDLRNDPSKIHQLLEKAA